MSSKLSNNKKGETIMKMDVVTAKKVDDFVDYCLGFYATRPYNFTPKMIRDCTMWFIKNQGYLGEFCGDSFDRERIRDFIINKHNIKINS